MHSENVIFYIFMMFTGAAVLSTVVLYTRQSLLVAYIALGMIMGPTGLGLIDDAERIKQGGEIGIIFLLFLLGLHLHPQNLLHMLKKVVTVALISSVVFAALGYGVGFYFGFTQEESLIIGAAMMFSSTIIGLKLLPTTILHHQHTGEVMISVLLMQDLIAIAVLLALNAAGGEGITWQQISITVVSLPGLILFAFLVERYVLVALLRRFDTIQEYIFILSIAWCLSMGEMAHLAGLSGEIGAFIAGVALAASPIALYIAESLKPLRDFFLVMFFFSVGATFKLDSIDEVYMPAIILATSVLLIKPYLFKVLLCRAGEDKSVSWEVGTRLGQASEFSILVAYLAMDAKLMSDLASSFVQAATIITFIVSSYLVVWRYPTPLAMSDKMRKD